MTLRTMRACQECGKPFYGSGDYYYCPECAKKKRLDTVIKIRICQDCGVEFYGGPRAKRCPGCAYKAQQETNRRHKKVGTKRSIGSVDKCVICGQEYTVTSGRQKYCSDVCMQIGVKAWQKEQKRGYNKKTGQEEKKQEHREAQEKICVYCLRPFKSNTSTNLCSDYCRSKQVKIRQCESDIRRGQKRNLQKYLNERQDYRDKVKAETE